MPETEQKNNAVTSGKFYGIRNSVNEWRSEWTKFCITFEDAKRELADCNDWYNVKGTGDIYEINFEISQNGVIEFSSKKIYEKLN